MRTGLSQRGWNNVLIFASLFMIILFNSTSEKFVNRDVENEKSTLIKADAVIQSIDFSGIKLERVGANWRVVSQLINLDELPSQLLTKTWQHQPFVVLEQVPELLPDVYRFPVVIYAIGYENAQVFELIIEPQNELAYVVNNNIKQWYVLDISQVSTLIPAVLLEQS